MRPVSQIAPFGFRSIFRVPPLAERDVADGEHVEAIEEDAPLVDAASARVIW